MRAGQGTTLQQIDWKRESAGEGLDKAPVSERASCDGKLIRSCRYLAASGTSGSPGGLGPADPRPDNDLTLK